MTARPIVCLFVLLCLLQITTSILRAAPEKAPTLVQFSTDVIDVRDAMLEIARTHKINLAIAPGVKGDLSLQTKDQKPVEALHLLAATVGCVVRQEGTITLVLPETARNRPDLPPLDIPADKKASAVDNRRAQFRRQYGLLARACGIQIAIGPGIKGHCPLFIHDAPARDLFAALAWVDRDSWCSLGKVLFVGTPGGVKAARRSFEDRPKP